jgi:ketosteroid isomerase-like protein
VDGVKGEVLETVEEGDRVLAQLHARGRDKESGDVSTVTFSAIFTFRAGKCARLEAFLDRELALRAWRASGEGDLSTG